MSMHPVALAAVAPRATTLPNSTPDQELPQFTLDLLISFLPVADWWLVYGSVYCIDSLAAGMLGSRDARLLQCMCFAMQLA